MWEEYDPQRDCVFCLDNADDYPLGKVVQINGVDHVVVKIHKLSLIEGVMIYLRPQQLLGQNQHLPQKEG